MKLCRKCQTTKPLNGFYPDQTHSDGHHSICKECVKADRRVRYAADPELYKARNRANYVKRPQQLDANRRLRRAALAAYGDRCACCDESRHEFLTIDHVLSDGAAHRRELRNRMSIYRWLRQEGYPQDGRFQVLCHNCNMAKAIYGNCPHLAA